MAIRGKATGHGHYVNGRESYIHRAWRAMILRCHDPKNQSFGNYGARGIVVCDRWRRRDDPNEGFAAFLADMGDRPTPDHSLDRIDNDGPYSPENCRWATREEQGTNRRTCRMIQFNSENVPVMVAAKALGVSHAVLVQRLNHGWSDREAVETPVAPYERKLPKYVTYDGQQMRLADASKAAGLDLRTVRRRLYRGWSFEDALSRQRRNYPSHI